MIVIAMIGTIFLHPDVGIMKTNNPIRLGHKIASRILLLLAWFTAILGLYQLIPNEPMKLAIYVAPMVCLLPYTLL